MLSAKIGAWTGIRMRKGIKSLPFRPFLKSFSPVQFLVTGYFFLVLVFTLLLMLPQASSDHKSQSFIDAFFVASSGISTTGLTPVDIGKQYTLFGQMILLTDFQIGGIGYMAVVVWLAGIIRRKLSLKSQMIAGESVAGAGWNGRFAFFKKVIVYTLLFEITGGLLLTACWLHRFSWPRAFYLGFFHSVSTFCTAGFSPFSNSLMYDQNNILVNFIIILLSWCGAIGFLVLVELTQWSGDRMKRRRPRMLTTHTRLAVAMSLLVMSVGTLVIFISESWLPDSNIFQRLLSASFQAVSASTTDGFNTLDIGRMTFTSLFVLILLMLIGASPGSTGGGIKTTTMGAILLGIRSQLEGRRDCNFQERRISEETVRRSFTILFLFVFILVADILVLSMTERIPFLPMIFETASALGNTGLSMGATSSLSPMGKLILSLTMFIGRVGPITIGLALLNKKKDLPFHYSEGTLQVG